MLANSRALSIVFDQPHQFVIAPVTDADIIRNLLMIISAKRTTVSINAECHELMYTIYKIVWWVIYLAVCSLSAASTTLSALPPLLDQQCRTQINVPGTIINACVLLMTFLNLSVLFATKYDSHCACYKKYMNLAGELDIIILQYNHNVDELQQAVLNYSHHIITLIDSEEPIPYCVHHYFDARV